MAEWFSTPDSEAQFSVAGWQEIGGDWNDVENGDTPLEALTEAVGDDYLAGIEQITVHLITEGGDDIYYTIAGPFADWEQIAEFVDDAADVYLAG